jgi:hypothetical protein
VEHRRGALAAAAYVAAMLVYIYGFVNPSLAYDDDVANAAGLAALVALHLATGFLGRRWWLVALPLLTVALAVPAGDPAKGYEPFPIWFGLALLVVLPGAVIIAIGIAGARLAARRRARFG